MQQQTKQRLVGVCVIVLVALIFLPLLFYQSLPGMHRLPSTTATLDQAAVHEVVYQLPLEEQAEPEQAAVAESAKPSSLKQQVKNHNTTTITTELPQAWVVQVATFADTVHARHLVSLLRQQGLLVYTKKRTSPLRIQVMVGPYIDRYKAEQLQQHLRQTLNLQGIIREYVT